MDDRYLLLNGMNIPTADYSWVTNLTTTGNITAGGMFLNGNINMQNNLILNIGNAGTDFTAGGGLTLALPLGEVSGGTGQNAYATGDILYASAVNTLTRRVIGNAGDVLVVAGGVPVWSPPVWVVPHAILSATHTDSTAAAVARGDLITGQGVAATWSRLVKGATGQIVTCNANDVIWSTATYPATTTINQILYSSAANTISEIVTGNSGVLVTGGTGIPSIATDIPTAVTIGLAYIYRAGGTDVPIADGGTGKSSWTQWGLVYADTATSLSQVAAGTIHQLLTSGGAGAPTWGTVTENAGALAAVTTINMSNQLTNTLAIGTAPFVITSTTKVANLYVDRAALSDTVTTNANLTGPITSVGNATSIASQTGIGTKFVVDTSPTLVTPNIGVATATSVFITGVTAPIAGSGLFLIGDATTGQVIAYNYNTLSYNELILNGSVNRFCIAGTEKVRVHTGGELGVGTAAPNEQLEITKNFRLPATTATTGIIKSGANTLIHTFGTLSGNFYAGITAGNLTNTGALNIGIGYQSLDAVTNGYENVGIGVSALGALTTGYENTMVGNSAGASIVGANKNTAVGYTALYLNVSGTENVAFGFEALHDNTGDQNTAVGPSPLYKNTTGIENIGVGLNALYYHLTGTGNIGIGSFAGVTINSANACTTGSYNIFIGYGAGFPNATQRSYSVAIGYKAMVNASNAIVLGGTGADAVNVGLGTQQPTEELTLGSAYTIGWEASAGVVDTNLYRSAADSLKTDDDFIVSLLLGVGVTPAARIHTAGNLSAAAWGTSGIGLRLAAATYTDTSSSGVVANAAGSNIAAPTFAASNVTTFTNAINLRIGGPPVAGANVTITWPYALYIASGIAYIDDGCWIGNATSTGAVLLVDRDSTSGTSFWALGGIQARFAAATYTDAVSVAGTVAGVSAIGIAQPTFAAADAGGVTYTNAATLYISNEPKAGTNVTLTYPWSIWVDSGDVRLDGGLSVGAAGAVIGSTLGAIDALKATGAILTLGRNDTSVTAGDLIGQIDFWTNDAQTVTNQTAARIEITARNTIATDINPGVMTLYTTGTAVGGALIECAKFQATTAAQIGFFGVAPVVRPTALTTALTTVTFTAPGTPDYAWGAGTNTNAYGWVTNDEFKTAASVIANLQTRVNEIETKLQSLGLLT